MAEVYGHKIHTKRMSTNIDALQKISENNELSKKDYKIFLFLSCRLESEFFKRIDIEQIADTLDLTKKDVKKSIEKLLEQEIIEEGSDEHISKGYKMCYTQTGKKGFYD